MKAWTRCTATAAPSVPQTADGALCLFNKECKNHPKRYHKKDHEHSSADFKTNEASDPMVWVQWRLTMRQEALYESNIEGLHSCRKAKTGSEWQTKSSKWSNHRLFQGRILPAFSWKNNTVGPARATHSNKSEIRSPARNLKRWPNKTTMPLLHNDYKVEIEGSTLARLRARPPI